MPPSVATRVRSRRRRTPPFGAVSSHARQAARAGRAIGARAAGGARGQRDRGMEMDEEWLSRVRFRFVGARDDESRRDTNRRSDCRSEGGWTPRIEDGACDARSTEIGATSSSTRGVLMPAGGPPLALGALSSLAIACRRRTTSCTWMRPAVNQPIRAIECRPSTRRAVSQHKLKIAKSWAASVVPRTQS